MDKSLMLLGPLHRLGLLVARILVRLRTALGIWRQYRSHRFTIGGHEVALRVFPTVYYPSKTEWASLFLAQHIKVAPGSRVWDMGTGTGIYAILAAKMGARVVATDINPAAVRCARLNVAKNGVADRVEIREGDLFSPVTGERFDHVLANFPFYALPVCTPDQARYSLGPNAELLRDFASGIRDHLRPGATLTFIFSENRDTAFFLDALEAQELRVEEIDARRRGGHRVVACRASLPR